MLAHRDGSFEYPQHMFWLEIRKIIFSYATLSAGLVHSRGFIKRREAGIFPFYSGMVPLLLMINLYRVYRQTLSNYPPTLP